jgi:rSAM/selenodomain-associated transferase 2
LANSCSVVCNPYSPLSIIVPVLNEERGIAQALARLEPQIVEGRVEVIVVDGGSRDGTLEIVRRNGLVHLVEFGRANRGLQMNAGASKARGEILLFLHADVGLPQAAIEAVNRAIDQERVLGGCFQIRFPAGAPPSLRIMAGGINFRTRLFRTATGDQAIFVRRDIFEAIGGYRNIPLMEDIAFFNGIKRLGRIAILKDRVEVSPRRWLEYGVWRTMLLMYALRFGYWIGVSPVTLKRFFADIR